MTSQNSQLQLDDRQRAAMSLLERALKYAMDVKRSPWEFAVEIERILAVGVDESDLRWMICKGYILHATEITLAGNNSREFQRPGGLVFDSTTCFVLNNVNARDLPSGIKAQSRVEPTNDHHVGESDTDDTDTIPFWDADRRELIVAGHLVKRFRLPSANQEKILSSFQEEAWPSRIDDPLPPVAECDCKRRLRDSICSLNRNQKKHLIRFAGDGTGEGVLWEMRDARKT